MFVAARIISPLTMHPGVLSAARVSPVLAALQVRSLRTSVPSHGLKWAKPVETVSLSDSKNYQDLQSIRNERPISPHLSIYQPQLTWLGSIGHRFTGAGLSALLYTYFVGYLAAPHIGLGDMLSSASIVQMFAQLPLWAKLSLKTPLAFAFSYHFWNGIRHLVWDLGHGMYMLRPANRSA